MIIKLLYSTYFHVIKTFFTVLFSILVLVFGFILLPFKNVRVLFLHYIGKVWGKTILFCGFIRHEVNFKCKIDKTKKYIFAGNHQSSIDIYLYYSYIPVGFRWIAKKSLLNIPFLGWAMYMMGHIFVEREDSKNAMTSLKKAINEVKSGISIAIFPEGTRSKNGELLPFKKGAFFMAKVSAVPIIPVVIKNAYKFAPKNSFLFDPRVRVYLNFLDEINPKEKDLESNFKKSIMSEISIAR